MFCTNCGRKLPDDIAFCPYCGTRVHTPDAAAAPVVEEPAVEPAPVAEEPVIEEPAVEPAPVAEEPVIEEPAVEPAPVAEEPVIEEPAVEPAPVAEEPVIEEPAVEPAPVAEEPVIEEPTVEPAPVAEEPVIEEPAVEPAPVAEEPVTEEPAVEPAPVAEEPIIEEPAVEPAHVAEEPVAAAATAAAMAAEPVAEAAEAAAEPAAEPAETVTGPSSIPPDEPPKKKKKGLIAAIIAIVVVALGVGGYFIYQSLPSTKLAKLRTQIASSIEAKDYQKAISQIEQAYEFAPDDEELHKQYVDCNLPLLSELYEAKDYEKFISDADKLIKDYPQAAEALDPMIKKSYESLANDAINTNDIPTMQAMKDRLTDLTASGRFNFSETTDWIEDNIQHVKLTNMFQTLADKLLPLIKSGDRAAVFDTIRSEFISSSGSARQLAPNKATVEYHFPLYSKADETGKRLGFYYSYGHYGFYYGNYNGTHREGDAIWIIADNLKTDTAYREYWAEGNWSNDKPNGTFTISNLTKYANSDKEQLVEGSVEVKDGLYNGKGVFTYDGSVPLSGSYKNGIADVIMTTDPNGNPSNVILISEDGNSWVSRANINDPIGIPGFY
ncbi:MAG: zinc-ribbon domain-containing protein [Firmicutes bacterium]|nr:zinc-ribbon domain-containing protein [Bacillota bacterium]